MFSSSHSYQCDFLKKKVENLVAIELAYINTKHPDFHKDAAFVSSLLKEADVDHLKHNKRLAITSTTSTSSSALIPSDSVSKNNSHSISFFHRIYYLSAL